MSNATSKQQQPRQDETNSTGNPRPVIAFLNREDSRRAVGNHQEILDALAEAGLGRVRYRPSFRNATLAEQARFAAGADILLGPHGAQFVNTLFQPECGGLLEFFNAHYYAPNFFGSLAALSGKSHFFVYNGGTSARVMHRHRDVPSFDVRPDVVAGVVRQMVHVWRDCCREKEQKLKRNNTLRHCNDTN